MFASTAHIVSVRTGLSFHLSPNSLRRCTRSAMTGSRICLARFSERRTPIEVTFDAALKGVKSGFEHENRVNHEGHILLKNGWDEAEEETCNASCDNEVDGKLNELWISGYMR